jgi:hypothetical protein
MSQSYTLTYQANGGSPIADGWVYLVNPYPSDITGNLNKASAYTHSGLSFTSVYMWDAPSGQWRVRTPSDSSQFVNIPSSKAFLIRVNPSGGTLTINESAKVKSNATFYREEPVYANYLKIKLNHNNLPDEVYDITSLKYDTNASNKFDSDLDAYKLFFNGGNQPSLSIYSFINDTATAINVKSSYNIYGDTTQLFINAPSGVATLSFLQPELLPDTAEAYLIDRFTGLISSIKESPLYEFQVTNDTLSKFKRFKIVFKSKERQTSLNDNKQVISNIFYPNPNFNRVIYSNYNSSELGNVELYNALGFKVADLNLSDSKLYIIPGNVPKGVYFLKFSYGSITKTEKIVLQ